jgi:hypothetical protein
MLQPLHTGELCVGHDGGLVSLQTSVLLLLHIGTVLSAHDGKPLPLPLQVAVVHPTQDGQGSNQIL